MTTRERNLLLIGLFAGLLVAGVISGANRWLGARREFTAPRSLDAVPSANVSQTARGAESMPAGDATASEEATSVQLTADEEKAIGVQTAVVERRQIRRPIVVVARVEEAETALSTISARIGGRVDRLFLDFTGQPVQRGQAVASIYSPELVATAQEYKLALENRARLGSRALPEAVAQADELVAAARRRLELWGITSRQIQEIESSAEPKIHTTIYSPTNGIVTERKVTEGQYVKEGDILYTVTDLSTVWVKAEVYESDLPLVRVGYEVEITSNALPGSKLRGRVSFLEPLVNQQTRTVPVRTEVPNPRLRLRPGMYVTAKFLTSKGEPVLAVPRSAVLDTGMRKIVYVATGDGLFEGRQVQLGPAGEEYYAVLSGLKEGERVVTHGNFLIDSQTRIAGGMTGLFGGSKEFGREAPAAAPGAPKPGANYQITFRTDPDPPKGGAQNTFRVTVTDAAGKPVSDAQVKVSIIMPAMPSMGMPEMRAAADLSWKGGEYVGSANVPMAGPWNVMVEVSRGGARLGSHRTRFDAQ